MLVFSITHAVLFDSLMKGQWSRVTEKKRESQSEREMVMTGPSSAVEALL